MCLDWGEIPTNFSKNVCFLENWIDKEGYVKDTFQEEVTILERIQLNHWLTGCLCSLYIFNGLLMANWSPNSHEFWRYYYLSYSTIHNIWILYTITFITIIHWLCPKKRLFFSGIQFKIPEKRLEVGNQMIWKDSTLHIRLKSS